MIGRTRLILPAASEFGHTRGRHADHQALIVDRQTARVTMVDFGVGLDPLEDTVAVLVQEAGYRALGVGDCIAADTGEANDVQLVADIEGVRVGHIHGDQPQRLRQRILALHEAGDF